MVAVEGLSQLTPQPWFPNRSYSRKLDLHLGIPIGQTLSHPLPCTDREASGTVGASNLGVIVRLS